METAVVTGAGRGIGREIARLLAGRGMSVLVTDLNLETAQETADLLGERAWPMALDVRNPEHHRAAARAATERGPVKVWVNNAGVLRTEKTWDTPDELVQLMVDVNLYGVLWGSRTAVEAMRGHGGDIVNMASMSAFGAVPGLAVYGATKHAVLGFTQSLQGDLDDAGIPIRTHAICPDGVDTSMVRERQGDEDAAIIFSTPRMLSPDEVAQKAVSLIGRRRPLAAIPASRSVLVRSMAQFPRASLRLLPLFKKAGEKKRTSVAKAPDGVGLGMSIPKRLNVVTVGARDVQAQRAFYTSLGWKSTTPGDDFAAFPLGGAVFSLYRMDLLAEESHSPPPPPGTWSGVTLAVNVEREEMVAEAIETARAAGAEIRAEPVKRDWGGVSAYFADPEGNVWEVAWFPDGQFDERGALIWPD